MEYCVACKCKLVPIGKSRKNGKSHTDWSGRQYHKACWKELTWQKTYFTVDYNQKDEAKALGAKWDADKKSWYAPNNVVRSNLLEKNFNRKL